MESLRRRTKNIKDGMFGQGACTFLNYRWIIVFLGLLNAVLFISAAVLGIKCNWGLCGRITEGLSGRDLRSQQVVDCIIQTGKSTSHELSSSGTKVKEDSIHVSHSSVSQLISEIDNLRSNHSNLIEAEKEAQRALEKAIKSHVQLKEQIEHQKTINNECQRKIAAVQEEKANLQSNISALEGLCGKCLPGWILLNSSCYFFSTTKSNWPDSRDDCKGRGSDLAVIDNQEEQEFVSNNINNIKLDSMSWGNGFWVGLTDIESEGKWVWINNVTEVEPRYWMDGEPNNHGYQGEDCAIVVYSSVNPWKTRYDGKCNEFKLNWICEMPSR